MQTIRIIDRAARFLGILAAFTIAIATPASPATLTSEDVAKILRAVVGVSADVPADARTAEGLGRDRMGSGVVIDENGLVLTIGYLILEAESASVLGPEGKEVPATIVAYDHETGFGLLRTLLPLDVEPMRLGDSAGLAPGDPVLAVGRTGPQPLTPQQVADRRPFAGYWEYLLDNAIFTAPPHAGFGGAALIGADGTLMGIGSLFVGDAVQGPTPVPGNMFVPVDLLKPIFADLLADGRRAGPGRPWLGLNTREAAGRVFVHRVVEGGPAEAAGIETGDVIMGVGGRTVRGMIDFFRKVHGHGPAGTDIPIDVISGATGDMTIQQRTIRSEDRLDWLHTQRGF